MFSFHTETLQSEKHKKMHPTDEGELRRELQCELQCAMFAL